MPKQIPVRQGDTRPLLIELDARKDKDMVTNLSDLQSGALYMWRHGSETNLVDGASVSATGDSTGTADTNRNVSFDPASATTSSGDAFANPGEFRAYVKVTWSDGNTSRHPQGDDLEIRVIENRE